jgi:predicted GIY-YIG superfamily endonuclease
MNEKKSKSETVLSWERSAAAAAAAYIPKSIEAVGTRCARAGCPNTKGISYEKPLCWRCWKAFDALEIVECERCHWFSDIVGAVTEEDWCFDCVESAAPPIYAHGPVERTLRYLYILKLDGGHWYVGQTNALELRVKEHQDGDTVSTKGKNPKLVWFEEWSGEYKELLEQESTLTRIAHENPRAIRRMVEAWQRPHQLVHWDA